MGLYLNLRSDMKKSGRYKDIEAIIRVYPEFPKLKEIYYPYKNLIFICREGSNNFILFCQAGLNITDEDIEELERNLA